MMKMQRVPMTSPIEYPMMAASTPQSTSSMFRNTYQSGFLSILYAIGQRPLEIWEKQVRSGHVKRVTDPDIRSLAIEILGSNVNTTFITTPINPQQALGIRLPFLVLVVKNIKRYFIFEVQVLDDTGYRRRFRACNFQAVTRVRPLSCTLPMKLEDGWNQIHMNLADLTRKIYGTNFTEALRVQIHANCRLRRVYFCEKLYGDEEVPADFKVFVLNAAKAAPSEAATKGDSKP
ncbi:unnamed protein product [Allacma fusca]|uniref:CFA20 domain-containing protein n=1 Tax=Allacma fusca TaxID=39272 RepID=A0A8J2K2U6_9HEXA|nr:unnamed protein product [Allacma fusca]